jgi:hypothetical protein
MNRDEMIAHLEIHGYRPFINPFDWALIWSDVEERGRMAKHFSDGVNGAGWDVRDVSSDMALIRFDETSWDKFSQAVLEMLTTKNPPPRFVHNPPSTHVEYRDA